MPFDSHMLRRFMEEEGFDNESFAREFGEFCGERGYKCVYNKRSVSRWRTGRSNPPLKIVDLLSEFAFQKGYEISFYVSPREKEFL